MRLRNLSVNLSSSSYNHACIKVTFARNLAKKLNSTIYYFNLLFQLSVVNPENFKEINAWEVLKFLKTKPEFRVTLVIWPNHYGNR